MTYKKSRTRMDLENRMYGLKKTKSSQLSINWEKKEGKLRREGVPRKDEGIPQIIYLFI